MMVRITTWNVNGIRNPLGYKPWSDSKTYNAMFDILEADIVIMQELKIQRKDLTDDMVLVPGWDCYFSLPKHKKGYSGVGIYTRQAVCAPIRAEEGLLGVLCPPSSSTPYRELPQDASIGGYPTAEQVAGLGVDPETLDAEGRCLVLEFPAFVLFGVYSPANSNGLRDDFRYGFLAALDTRIRNLAGMGKNVILTGDLNVSRDLIDTAKAEDHMRSEGMTYHEFLSTPNRRVFNQLLMNGNVPGERDNGRNEPILYDLCREFHPTREGMYTHWEQKINARPGNFGSRIDFVLCSIVIKNWFKEANIQEGLMGSDHCPVYAVTQERVFRSGDQKSAPQEDKHILDIMNPSGMFVDGVRQREYSQTKDVPPLSGRLLPEFTKRRNIRDMFNSKLATINPKPTSTSTDVISDPITNVKSTTESTSRKVVTSQAATMTDVVASAVNTSISPPPPISIKSPEKRRAPPVSPIIPVKRNRSNPPVNSNATSLKKGQQSLKGFFRPHNKTTDSKSSKDVTTQPPSISFATKENKDSLSTPAHAESVSNSSHDPSMYIQTDPLASQEASKEGWTKLFSRKSAPRCEGHAEPCMILTTKKPGVNCGRQFYLCSRPIGPSGQKESGTQWRCGTFIWASDWKG